MPKTRVRAYYRGAQLSTPEMTYTRPAYKQFSPDRVAALEAQIKALKSKIKRTPHHHHGKHAQHKAKHASLIRKLKKELRLLNKSKHKTTLLSKQVAKGVSHFIKKEEEHAAHWWKTRGAPATKKAAKKTAKWLGHEAHVAGKWAVKEAKQGFHAFGDWVKKKWQEHKEQKALKAEVGTKLETYE